MDSNTSTHKKSLQSSMTKRKTNTVILPGHVQSNGSKILSQGFIRQRWNMIRFDVGINMKTSEEDERLLINPLKGLRLKIGAGERVKKSYVC